MNGNENGDENDQVVLTQGKKGRRILSDLDGIWEFSCF